MSALGKILKYQGQILGEDFNKIFDIWINNMPIKQDEEEGLINNQFLMDILMKEQNKVIGQNNKNLGQIIIILSKAYKTDMSDEIMDNNIEQFANGVKNNKEYNNILMELISKQKEKRKKH